MHPNNPRFGLEHKIRWYPCVLSQSKVRISIRNFYLKKYHIIYQTTNLINGFIYIGRHSTDRLEDGYLGSGNEIKNSIKEFGKKNFKKEILFIFDNPDEMIAKEVELVTDEFRKRDDTYNLALGGGEWNMLGKTHTEETKAHLKIVQSNRTFTYKHSEEMKAQMSKERKGKKKPPVTEKHRENLSQALSGKKRTLEQRKNISNGNKGERSEARLKQIKKMVEGNRGKLRSAETRENISKGHQRRSFIKKMTIINSIIYNLIDSKGKINE